jgi:hypothetical protein
MIGFVMYFSKDMKLGGDVSFIPSWLVQMCQICGSHFLPFSHRNGSSFEHLTAEMDLIWALYYRNGSIFCQFTRNVAIFLYALKVW